MPTAKVTLVDSDIDATEIEKVGSFGTGEGGHLYLWNPSGSVVAIVASGQWVAAAWRTAENPST